MVKHFALSKTHKLKQEGVSKCILKYVLTRFLFLQRIKEVLQNPLNGGMVCLCNPFLMGQRKALHWVLVFNGNVFTFAVLDSIQSNYESNNIKKTNFFSFTQRFATAPAKGSTRGKYAGVIDTGGMESFIKAYG